MEEIKKVVSSWRITDKHKCPNDILEDACSRQDYSGAELVKEYLN